MMDNSLRAKARSRAVFANLAALLVTSALVGALMLPTYVRRALHALSLNNNDLVPRVQLPLQIIVGDRDATQSATDLRALAARLPAARVDVVEGAGHATFIDAPGRFDALLRDFAASNP